MGKVDFVHLNHEFFSIEYDNLHDHFKCNKCNIIVWDCGSETREPFNALGRYIVFENKIRVFGRKLLSCEEEVIKNIIE